MPSFGPPQKLLVVDLPVAGCLASVLELARPYRVKRMFKALFFWKAGNYP